MRVDSVSKKINVYLPWNNATVEKVVFSPFGNQIVITTPPSADENNDDDDPMNFADISRFALFDENGKSLDIINTGYGVNNDGSSKNSFEFLKADLNTKLLKFVPIKYCEKSENSSTVFYSIGEYPLEYEVSDYGKIVVTDIRIKDGEIDIDYYKDGFVEFEPAFLLCDDDGNNVEPGGKLGCTLSTDIHYDTNSYTAKYVYEAYDDSGRPLPMPESENTLELKKRFTKLGIIQIRDFILDFDNAVSAELK